MNILITGGSGFLGSYLKNYLERAHTVFSPTSKELNLTDVESVSKFFEDKFFDVVIHSAVVGRENVTVQSTEISSCIISMFTNLLEQRKHYGKFINFGSGAEFGLDRSIDEADESMIFDYCPIESYGYGKNVIARSIRKRSGFYNLRIFSCLDPSESDNRLLKKFLKKVSSGEKFKVDQDRYVDFVSLRDVATVVDAVINDVISDNDINLVYQHKYLISDLLRLFCKTNNFDESLIEVTGCSNKNYTGSSRIIEKYNLDLEGLVPTMKQYIR